MSGKKIRVGVVGVGHLGAKHARIYSQMPEVDLVRIADIDLALAKSISAEHGGEATKDYRTLFERVDVVSIVVPTDLHYSVGKDFLRAGINVLIEKPITQTLAQAEELISIANEKNLVLQVGHVERFNSAVREIVELVKSPRFIEVHRLSPYQTRGTEVGVVLDLMVHDIDMILYLVKYDIERIDAVGATILSQYEDIANVRILFANGAVANLTASRVSDETMRKIRIFQDDLYISLDYVNQDVAVYRKEGERITKRELSFEKDEPLRLELKDFIECVAEGRKPLVPGESGMEALSVARRIEKEVRRETERCG